MKIDKKKYDPNSTYCSYCGFRVPIEDEAGTKITEHILTCDKHPINGFKREFERLERIRAAAEEKCKEIIRESSKDPTVDVITAKRLIARRGAAQDILFILDGKTFHGIRHG
jgi:hypothetical protein